MTGEKTYRYRLIVHGKVVYEDTIDEHKSPREALSWGLYWIPGDWIQREGSNLAPIHAEACIVTDEGRLKACKSYDNRYLEDVSQIRGFDDEDLKHLLRGQDLVWKITDDEGKDATGRLFSRYEYAEEYCYDNCKSRFDIHIVPVWVDGWYDEQYSWKATKVKGYDIKEKITEGKE